MVRVKDVCIDMHQGINTVVDKVEYKEFGTPIIQSKNITKGVLDLEDVRFVDKETHKKYLKKYNPQINDLLFCNIGTIGKPFVVSKDNDFLIAWNLFLIKLNNLQINSTYLSYFFSHLERINYFDKLLTGGTVKFINKTKMGNIEIPLPHLEIQEQIANTLDTAAELLTMHNQQLSELDKLIKSTFYDMFGDPVTNPMGWETIVLGNCLDRIESGWSPKCQDRAAVNEEWGICKLSAVTRGYYKETENKAIFKETKVNTALEVKNGNLLFCRKNTIELVGSCAYVFQSTMNLMIPDTIFRLCTKDNIHELYLYGLLKCQTFKPLSYKS